MNILMSSSLSYAHAIIKGLFQFFLIATAMLLSACSQPHPSDVLIDQVKTALGDDETLSTIFKARAAELGVTAASIAFRRDDGEISIIHHGDDVNDESLFQAASMSKAVAAITIMTLADSKGISLDEDIRLHTKSLNWDAINPEKREVTLRQLLSHTAGATVSGFAGYNRGKPLPSSVDIVHGKKTRFHDLVKLIGPAGQFRYSGGGYQIAQVFAEDISGQPFATLAKSMVLTPLGMSKSTFKQPIDITDITPLHIAGARTRFRPQEGVFWPMENSWRNYPEQAAAGLWTTAADYSLFVAGFIDAYKGVSGASIPQSIAREALTVIDASYGLGLMIESGSGNKVSYFGHSGANTGYRCGFRADPQDGRFIVVMTNAPGGSILWQELSAAVFPQ